MKNSLIEIHSESTHEKVLFAFEIRNSFNSDLSVTDVEEVITFDDDLTIFSVLSVTGTIAPLELPKRNKNIAKCEMFLVFIFILEIILWLKTIWNKIILFLPLMDSLVSEYNKWRSEIVRRVIKNSYVNNIRQKQCKKLFYS